VIVVDIDEERYRSCHLQFREFTFCRNIYAR